MNTKNTVVRWICGGLSQAWMPGAAWHAARPAHAGSDGDGGDFVESFLENDGRSLKVNLSQVSSRRAGVDYGCGGAWRGGAALRVRTVAAGAGTGAWRRCAVDGRDGKEGRDGGYGAAAPRWTAWDGEDRGRRGLRGDGLRDDGLRGGGLRGGGLWGGCPHGGCARAGCSWGWSDSGRAAPARHGVAAAWRPGVRAAGRGPRARRAAGGRGWCAGGFPQGGRCGRLSGARVDEGGGAAFGAHGRCAAAAGAAPAGRADENAGAPAGGRTDGVRLGEGAGVASGAGGGAAAAAAAAAGGAGGPGGYLGPALGFAFAARVADVGCGAAR